MYRQPYTESIVRGLVDQALVVSPVATAYLPPIPGMIEEYLTVCDRLCADLGGDLAGEERARVERRLKRRLAQGRAISTRSVVQVVLMVGRGRPVQSRITVHTLTTLNGFNAHWLQARKPFPFGSHPDARVSALADEADNRGTHRVLDIGAGTGRNALALARRGHPVDAVELSEEFADIMRRAAEAESLDVRVIAGDVFSTIDVLRHDYRLILLSEVVSDFVSTQQLRSLFELAGQCLAPGGRLLFNAFLARRGYQLDQPLREFGQYFHTGCFSRDEMRSAAGQRPRRLWTSDLAWFTRCDQRVVLNARRFGVVCLVLRRRVWRR